MNQPDWSKAPASATLWFPGNDEFRALFYKVKQADYCYWDEGKWNKSDNIHEFKHLFIERQAEVKPSEWIVKLDGSKIISGTIEPYRNASMAVEFLAGTSLRDAIIEAKQKASFFHLAFVTFNFNGVPFSISADADVDEAIKAFDALPKTYKAVVA